MHSAHQLRILLEELRLPGATLQPGSYRPTLQAQEDALAYPFGSVWLR